MKLSAPVGRKDVKARAGFSNTMRDRIMVMTAQPGREKALIDVPFERPRHVLELRARPEYGELVYSIWSRLRDEVQQARLQDEAMGSK